eukprot:gene4682-3375_t
MRMERTVFLLCCPSFVGSASPSVLFVCLYVSLWGCFVLFSSKTLFPRSWLAVSFKVTGKKNESMEMEIIEIYIYIYQKVYKNGVYCSVTASFFSKSLLPSLLFVIVVCLLLFVVCFPFLISLRDARGRCLARSAFSDLRYIYY